MQGLPSAITTHNWATDNNGFPLEDAQVLRFLQVLPSEAQLSHGRKPFYAFLHFGMNTATGREWGCGTETPDCFDLTEIYPEQWVEVVRSSGATGIIFTCKHHDGFCLWDTKLTDFSVMHAPYGKDIVRQTADACRAAGLDFGVYLSPWDMHEPSYGSGDYNRFFLGQLTELLTGYGPLFEVWFDGAKGADAREFEYDWDSYYRLIRKLQPAANIAVCGPDLRWVGNEAGKTRTSEFSVVPLSLTRAEIVQKKSQHSEEEAGQLRGPVSQDEDLGSRAVLEAAPQLHWYPAEVDVSIRPGWFYHESEDAAVKTAEELFEIYLQSVGSNCCLLLNVPPAQNGRIHEADAAALRELGEKIADITRAPVREESPGGLAPNQGFLRYDFPETVRLRYCILEEDLCFSQRVEAFDLYLRTPAGAWEMACSGTVIGSRKILRLDADATGAVLVFRQSRSAPHLAKVAFYQ